MEETNPYLALRAEKIARNQARLAELGLVQKKTTRAAASKSAVPTTKKNRMAKVSPGLRRSPRNTYGRAPSYTDPTVLPEPKRRKAKPQEEDHGGVLVRATTPAQSYPDHSARSMDIHVDKLVTGGLLGAKMDETGKAFVMQEAARRCSHVATRGISFNKYCGVQEWKNDAMFLWVNLGCGDMINEFMNGGRQMTWYGGSRMHDESNVILRLLRVGQSAANGDLPSSDGLVLWCRSVDAATRSYTPYVCLGRLSYQSHERGSRPLKFVWNLVDYDRLINHDDKDVQKMFQELVSL